MYSVGKPELTYDYDLSLYLLSVVLTTAGASITGVSYFVLPMLDEQTEDYNVAKFITHEYHRALENAYALATDSPLTDLTSFISPDTHVSKGTGKGAYPEQPFELYVGLRPEQPGDDIIKPADMRMSTVGPTKVSSKPNDKVGSALFCRDCLGEITEYVSGTAVMPAAEVAKMTLGRWKRQLCAACSVAALKRR